MRWRLPDLRDYFHRNTALRYFAIYGAPTWSGVSTLNYGYAPVSEEVRDAPIASGQYFQIELYRQALLALQPPLSPGQCLCEVSCGRGGGLAFAAQQTGAQCVGLEKSWPARRYAAKRFGLDVRKAVAPLLPLADASVDAFISVEAFHNYANDQFLQEMARCLKPGGQVVVADRRKGPLADNRKFLISLFERNGFRIGTFRDIMPNVLAALREDHDRKEKLLRVLPKTFIHDELREMFACTGSKRYIAFEHGDWSYFLMSAVL